MQRQKKKKHEKTDRVGRLEKHKRRVGATGRGTKEVKH